MSAKTFTYRFIALVCTALVLVVVINALIDSRWIFSFNNSLNEKRPSLDERIQKTNYLVNQNPHFNNLILGSSRASYFPTSSLKGRWYNYAVSGMYPDEYIGYAKIAEQYAKNQKLDTIIIGLDFWATCKCAIVEYKSPELILADSKSWLKQSKNLLSIDALDESFKTAMLNISPSKNEAYYSLPSLEKNRTQIDSNIKAQKLKEQLWYYKNDVFGNKYEYNSKYINPLNELIRAFPKTHFILYSSPVSPELENLKIELGRAGDETRWRNQINGLGVEFIVLQKDQFNSEMFFDAHHLKPDYFNLITAEM